MKRSEDADPILDRRRAELTDDARRSIAGVGHALADATRACARVAPKRTLVVAGAVGFGLGVAGPSLLCSLRGVTRFVVAGIPPLVRLGWRLRRNAGALAQNRV
jgi:hypothetical protein